MKIYTGNQSNSSLFILEDTFSKLYYHIYYWEKSLRRGQGEAIDTPISFEILSTSISRHPTRCNSEQLTLVEASEETIRQEVNHPSGSQR